MKRLVGALAATCAAFSASAQIVSGQLDDFQDGTVMGWTGGTGPTNVPDGGPMGAGDRFMRLTSAGASGPGSRLGAFNAAQWSGDYASAGVTAVSVDLRNPSDKDLEVRAVLFSTEGARWTSTTSFALPAMTDWTRATFSLLESDLTLALGSTPYATLMSDVQMLMFRHDGGAPDATGEPIEAEMGVDNIEAVPEPVSFAALAVGLGALVRRRVSRSMR